MRPRLAAAFLIAIGCLQMAGDLSGSTALKGVGLALQASPAPKVFTAQNGFETFSSRFYIGWSGATGEAHSLEVSPAVYRAVRGPYNRRNAYGAALSYGPVLAGNPRTRPMLEHALDHAFCGAAPMRAELSLPSATPLTVKLVPRDERSADPRWQLTFPIDCNPDHGRTQ